MFIGTCYVFGISYPEKIGVSVKFAAPLAEGDGKEYNTLFRPQKRKVMNVELLKKAHERVPSVPVLVNLISKREKQLIAGDKPLVRPLNSDEDKVDTALREVAEGKLISEIDFDAIARAEDAKTKWHKHATLKSIFAD